MNQPSAESTGGLAPVRTLGDIWQEGGKWFEKILANERLPLPVFETKYDDQPIVFGVRDKSGERSCPVVMMAGPWSHAVIDAAWDAALSADRDEIMRLLGKDEPEMKLFEDGVL